MLLTIRNVSAEFVNKAKLHTGKGSGSQALIASVEIMLTQGERIRVLEAEVARLREDLRRRQVVLNHLAPLCAQVVEMTGHKDLGDSI